MEPLLLNGLLTSNPLYGAVKIGLGVRAYTLQFGVIQTAQPTASNVLVNGAFIDLQAYHISGNNFFKLRDIAYVLNGTSAQFNVEFEAFE